MSEPIQTSPHDTLFRHAFGQVQNAAGLLKVLLPAQLVAAVDWESLTQHEGSNIDERMRELESDLVFSARVTGREVLFYFLVEHQSSPDRFMVFRLWQYMTRVWEKWRRDHPGARRLPRLVPIVVYHGERSWSAPRSLAALLEDEPAFEGELAPLVPQLTYILDDLTVLGPEELRARALPAFASLVLWALRNAAERSFVQTVGVFRDLFDDVYASTHGAEALGAIFRYLSIVTGEDEKHIVDGVLAQLSPPVREEAMSLYDRLIQQGKAEGKAEGEASGRAKLLLKLLQLKFGAVPDDVRDRIGAASIDELDRWGERVLTATTLEDVLR